MLHIMHLYVQLTRLDDKYCYFRETHRWKSRKCSWILEISSAFQCNVIYQMRHKMAWLSSQDFVWAQWHDILVSDSMNCKVWRKEDVYTLKEDGTLKPLNA